MCALVSRAYAAQALTALLMDRMGGGRAYASGNRVRPAHPWRLRPASPAPPGARCPGPSPGRSHGTTTHTPTGAHSWCAAPPRRRVGGHRPQPPVVLDLQNEEPFQRSHERTSLWEAPLRIRLVITSRNRSKPGVAGAERSDAPAAPNRGIASLCPSHPLSRPATNREVIPGLFLNCMHGQYITLWTGVQ